MCGFNFYFVMLFWLIFLDMCFINGFVIGFKIKFIMKNFMLNNVNIINFVIRIFGIILFIVLCNELIVYVNGKYGEMFWKNCGVVWIGNVFLLFVICNISNMIVMVLFGLLSNDMYVYMIELKIIE